VLLGASAGGPGATAALLGAAGPLDVPVVIAQHLPAGLATEVAAALAARIGRPVSLAADGARPGPGEIVMLPDGLDGALRRDDRGLVLGLVPAAQPLSPSVDILFASAAAAARNAVGVVLSGMGRDGTQGARALAEAGMPVLAQSATSCLVCGMPGAVEGEGLALLAASPVALGERLAAMCRATGSGGG
jgi:two-component system chemotaxis response regulator CheB